MAISPINIGTGPNTLALVMAEDAYLGDAQFTVSVDGTAIGGTQTVTALKNAGATQLFNVAGSFGPGAHTVAVNFLNDAYGGTATTDRNLYVVQASIDGTAVPGASLVLARAGTQSFGFTGPGGAPAGAVNLGSGPDVLALSISEDAYLGDAQFTVSVDGAQVGGTQTATASHNGGASQLFNIAGTYGPGAHSVTVNFLNDAYGGAGADRNLFVTQASLNGTAIGGASLSLFSAGPQSFSFTGNGAAPPPATGSDSFVLSVSEDAYNGDAQFTVSVDGITIGGVRTATASHSSGASNQVTLSGSFGPGAHTVAVSFINDAYAGTPSTDRNLFVTGLSYNGAAVPGATASLLSNGTASFAVPAFGTTPPPVIPPPVIPPPVVLPPPVTPPVTTGPGFYVATGGSDSNDGSLARPFATLARAVSAMENSTLHTTYLQGGSYGLNSTLSLTGAHSGFTIAGYNNQRPVLFDATGGGLSTLVRMNGASNVTISGIAFNAAGREAVEINGGGGNAFLGNRIKDAGSAIVLNGSTGNTLSGNEIDNSGLMAIELKDGANGNLIDSNFVNGVGGSSTHGGGVYAHGVNDNRISHNLIQHTGGSAITFVNYDFATINVGNTVDYNRVLDSGYATGYDSGSIYVLGRSYVDTKMSINNNYIDGTGAGGNAHTIALYLDDDASGVSVTNNIARNVGTHAFQIHGGHDNSVVNNILDLDTTTNSAGFFQAIEDTPASTGRMYNNIVQRNIIEAHKPQTVYENFHGGSFSIFNNLYFNASGGALQFNPDAADTAPKFGNPLFQNEAAGNFALQSGTAATQIGFNPIDQGSIGLKPTGPQWY